MDWKPLKSGRRSGQVKPVSKCDKRFGATMPVLGSVVILLMIFAGACNEFPVSGIESFTDELSPGKKEPVQMQSPVRLTRGKGATVYVSDYGANVVHEVKVAGNSVRTASVINVAGGPTGVAYTKGVILVGDSENGEVSGYETRRGRKLFTLGLPGEFLDPIDIEVDESLKLAFILDARHKVVKVFDLETRAYVRSIGGAGESAEMFQNPTGLAIDSLSNEVIVSDYGSLDGSGEAAAIKIFDYEGGFIDAISGKLGMLGQRFSRVQGLTVDADGSLLVADALSGEILVIDRATKSVTGSIGSFGDGEGELWLPLDVVVGANGAVIVTNNRSRRLEILDRAVTGPAALSVHEPVDVATLSKTVGTMLLPDHECSFCHSLHGAASSQLLNNANKEALCMTCHGPGGPSTLKGEVHVYDGSTCADCHASHSNVANSQGGTNIKLIKDQVYALGNYRPAVFESRGTDVGDPTLHSFCDGDEDGNDIWDAVCDTCHTSNSKNRHEYTDTSTHRHKQGVTCTRCHGHSTGFDR